MTMEASEANFDGIVGPTHHYAALAAGNLASQRHGGDTSNPRQAALEGLAKMKYVAERGVLQAVLPPQERPDVAALRRLGFGGSDADVLRAAARDAPQLLAACGSASAMWAANAATVSPAADTADHRIHITPANLIAHLHRSLEAAQTTRLLQTILPDESQFVVHDPLPAAASFADEGAANHMRFAAAHGDAGFEVFVYGRDGQTATSRFAGRQTLGATQALIRRHQLQPGAAIAVQQHPAAIDAGVFHNDVIAVSHRNVLLYHEHAWVDTDETVDRIRAWFAARAASAFHAVRINARELPLEQAVSTYLFNSQLLDRPDGGMLMLCPAECEQNPAARAVIERVLTDDNPIREVAFINVRQSMNNGGGPACLRLRVVLTRNQQRAVHRGVWWSPSLHEQLEAWVKQHYRDELRLADLADPALLDESRTALDALTRILQLGDFFAFQR